MLGLDDLLSVIFYSHLRGEPQMMTSRGTRMDVDRCRFFNIITAVQVARTFSRKSLRGL